ncbi:MAG TPA: chromate efflux transporter, partial [Roseimicrobium sp.]|nr:chromate efflux transporter [Roseimicrobium sp.]
MSSSTPACLPTFADAFRVWMRIGLLSFGGPSGQIALMHEELVERRRWLNEDQFLRALNFCMLLPGPEAHQLAVYTGWILHGVRGGLVAGTLFVMPGALLLLGISILYTGWGTLPWLGAIFEGLKPAVVAIVAGALLRIGQRALKTRSAWLIAGAAFVSLYWFNMPFPLVILAAGATGWMTGRTSTAADETSAPATEEADWTSLTRRSVSIAIRGTIVWWAPAAILVMLMGPGHVLVREAVFFAKAALMTFGGAYAVLPYVAQQAVEHQGWLSTSHMIDGLALAETTPGPLILVLQFVGYLCGWNHPAPLPQWSAALLGAFIASWMTFVPSFIFIFAGAPWVERLKHFTRINGALEFVTAAVVGVILN